MSPITTAQMTTKPPRKPPGLSDYAAKSAAQLYLDIKRHLDDWTYRLLIAMGPTRRRHRSNFRVQRKLRHNLTPLLLRQHYRCSPKTRRTRHPDHVVLTSVSQRTTPHSKLRAAAHQTPFDTDSFDIRIDNHSSYCVSNTRSDFTGPLKPFRARLLGMGGTTDVRLHGTVKWKFDDDLGQMTEHVIHNTLYVPTSPGRILSPQHWGQQCDIHHQDYAYVKTDPRCVQLHWGNGTHTKTIPLDPQSNVAIMQSSPGFQATLATCSAFVGPPDTLIRESDETFPLSPRPITFGLAKPMATVTDDELAVSDLKDDPRSILLQWHHRLHHLSFNRIRQMAKNGLLPRSILSIRTPVCTACQLGRATRRPWRTKAPVKSQSVPPARFPGDCVSVDQLQSTCPGLIPQIRGFITKRRYEYATIFVDQASSLGFVHLQESSNMSETLQAKQAFENFARARGVIIKHYHADNGRFAEKGWLDNVKQQGQTTSFCGVNAHHQNGVAEKRIRDLQDAVRVMLIHSKQRWPDAIETYLWPFALSTANYVHNHTPSLRTGQSPISIFSQLEEDTTTLRNFHTFGCPAFVLKPTLQAGGFTSKWDERAHASINLGPSQRHGSSVHLLLNLQTGIVTPQFHVRFDDFFDSTRKDASLPLPPSSWQSRTYFRPGKSEPSEKSNLTTSVPAPAPSLPMAGRTIPGPVPEETPQDARGRPVPTNAPAPQTLVPLPAVTTRSGRSVRTPQRYLDSLVNVSYDGTDELTFQWLHPLVAFLASSNPDILYLHEAMAAPDREEFRKAMLKEVRDHESRGHWVLVPLSSVPEGATILPAVWSMRRKRLISTGEVYKWKSRLTLGGHKQRKGIDYDQTYSPVVGWPTIRLFLAFFLIAKWCTRQLDFVLAYPQAKVERDMYMALPKGFEYTASEEPHVIKLIQNMYGARQAGRQWYLHVTEYLLQLGFQQSSVDPCVFYMDSVILLLFVDDVILGAATKELLNAAIDLLKDNVDVDDQGDISDYLGVHVTRHDDETLELAQPHLIKSILDDLRLNDESKRASTPAVSTFTSFRLHNVRILDSRSRSPSIHDSHSILYSISFYCTFCSQAKEIRTQRSRSRTPF